MLEKIQESVRLNKDYISWKCAEYHSAWFAWRWRTDHWNR